MTFTRHPRELSGLKLTRSTSLACHHQLDELTLQKTSIKALLTSKNLPEKDSKRLLALVIETLKYKPTILELLEKIPLTKDDKKALFARSKNLALVLVHDLLFSAKPG